MSKPLFSIVAIAKNEANTLPRLLQSIKPFLDRGGEFVLLDTGSTDKTAEIAQKGGAIVHEVGEKFITVIDQDTAKAINDRFIVENEPPIVFPGSRLFDFAAARNHVTSLATNDFVITLDCDEAYSSFDIDAINQAILEGVEQMEYQFVYAHDHTGRAVVQFVQSKAFDRRKVQWEGIVHEVLQGQANIRYMPEHLIKLEHWQEQGKEHRGNYLVGLGLACIQKASDRNFHYLARELGWTNRPKSAIKLFEEHIQMGGWVAERAQSMIHMGECYGRLNDPDSQIQWFTKAFALDSRRREALIHLAFVFRHQNNPHACAAYAAAALQLPWVDYYANNKDFYEHVPHELLYQSLGQIGDGVGAAKHLQEALRYQPYNQRYLFDTRFFFEYPNQMVIEGWMRFDELQFLYNESQKHLNILEVGSWKAKSAHSILSGLKKANKGGKLTCVDTWQGSIDPRDDTNWMAKREDVFEVFKNNLKDFDNYSVVRKESVEAAKDFEDGTFDMIFIDAGHDFDSVVADIRAWKPKLKKGGTFIGHDYERSVWMSVVEAVNQELGTPDEVHDSIWCFRNVQ